MTDIDDRKRMLGAIVHVYIRFAAAVLVVAACLAVQLSIA